MPESGSSASNAVAEAPAAWVTPSREESMARLMNGARRVMNFRRDMDLTVADRLEQRVADHGDLPFIIFEEQSISFAEGNRRANRIAHAALDAGFGKGDVIALLMENRPEFVLTWLGLCKAGVVTALINTSATGKVLSHALRQVKAKALIFGSELASSLDTLTDEDKLGLEDLVLYEQAERPEQRKGGGQVEDFNAACAAASDADPDRKVRAGIVMGDPHYLIFTSGTTGLPKAAKMSHMRFLNAGEMVGGLLQFTPEDVFYCVLPLYHGAGGMVVPSASLAFGTPFVLRRRFSTSGFWTDVRRHRITAVYYIGEVIRYLLTPPPSPEDRGHTLRAIAGAGMKPDVWAEFIRRFGITTVVEGLGSTEANFGITNVDNKIGSVGRLPYPQHTNVRIVRYDVAAGDYVRDAEGKHTEAKPGEIGEVWGEVLGGTGVAGFFEGYTSAEATEGKLSRDVWKPGDVWFRSGDLVRFDEDDYFYFIDRIGDTYRWKSENVSTQEVEVVLTPFPGPSLVNIYGVTIPGTEGRAGMAALTYEDPAAFDAAAFWSFCTARLAAYAVPVFVRLTRSTAMTTTFKLRKVEVQREGYDPELCGGDPLFVADPDARTYVPVTPETLRRLGYPPFRNTVQ